jgi:hypothetical protein
LSWHCFPPFDSSPNGEPLIGERIRQVANLPPLEAGGWRLEADCSIWAQSSKDNRRLLGGTASLMHEYACRCPMVLIRRPLGEEAIVGQ